MLDGIVWDSKPCVSMQGCMHACMHTCMHVCMHADPYLSKDR